MLLRTITCIVIYGCSAVAAQTFEVASVKRSGPQSVRNFEGGPGTRDPEQITCTVANLKDLMLRAYDVEGFQIEGPAWISSEDSNRYDLHANVPAGTTKEQAFLMMRNLLAERFQLKVHEETRQFPVFDLVIAKGGPKFKEAVPGSPAPAPKPGYPEFMPGRPQIAIQFHETHARLYGHAVPMARVVFMLKAHGDRPIIDKTGLTGTYDFMLDYDPAGGSGPPDDSPDAAPVMSVAIEQQLGLKFQESRKSFTVIVVDRAEKIPTEN
jgi:uncharacterized protein (TIGR03435 family)